MLCVLRNRRKSHSNTSSTATQRGTIDGRDASLLSMVKVYTVEPHYNGHLGPNLAGCYIEVAVLLSGIQNHHN